MIKVRSRRILAIIGVYIFFAFVYLFSLDIKVRPVNLNNYLQIDTRYLIAPTKQSLYASGDMREYPYVQTPPWSLKYPLVYLNEKVEIYNGKRDELFFANKRVAELNKFGNELRIFSTNDLLPFKSWENVLARYSAHLENTFNEYSRGPEKERRLLSLLSHLERNENLLYQRIFNSTFSPKEKVLLRKMVRSITEQFRNKIPNDVHYPNPSRVGYSLTEIIRNRNYGHYDITFKAPDEMQIEEGDFFLAVGTQKYAVHKIPSTNEFVVRNVYFKPGSRYLNLILRHNINEVKNIHWTKETNNIFTLELDPKKLTDTILVKIRYQSVKPIGISIQQTFWEEKQPAELNVGRKISTWLDQLLHLFRIGTVEYGLRKSDDSEELVTTTALDEFLDPDGKVKKITRFIRPRNDRIITQFRVQVYSNEDIDNTDLDKIEVNVLSVFLPSLTLTKVQNMPKPIQEVKYKKIKPNYFRLYLSNLSLDEENYLLENLGFFWQVVRKESLDKNVIIELSNILPKLAMTGLATITLLIFFTKFIFPKIWNLWTKNMKSWRRKYLSLRIQAFSHIYRFARRYRKLLFLSALTLLSVNIFVIPIRSTLFVSVILLLLWLTIRGYRRRSEVLITAGLVLMMLCIVSYIFKFYLLADNAAAWFFLLLLMSTILICLEK